MWRLSEFLEYLVISCKLVSLWRWVVIKYLISLITSAPKLNGCVFTTNLHSCPNILPYCMPCNENPKHTDGKYFVINYFLILNMGAANCFGAPMS